MRRLSNTASSKYKAKPFATSAERTAHNSSKNNAAKPTSSADAGVSLAAVKDVIASCTYRWSVEIDYHLP